MDPFSQILSGVVLKGALFFNAEFSAPWGFNAPTAQELAPFLAPDAPHLLVYHFLVEGSANCSPRKRRADRVGAWGCDRGAARRRSRNVQRAGRGVQIVRGNDGKVASSRSQRNADWRWR